MHSKSRMKNICARIQGYLANPPHSKNFCQANLVYNGYICKRRRLNMDKSKHKDMVLEEEVTKLADHVFDETATGLQRRVFL